jgi:hypothetical protein
VSKSANNPFISFSDGYPFAEDSILENIFAKSVFKLSLSSAFFTILVKSWLG